MTGERDLSRLLSGMNPKTMQGEYVFCTIDRKQLKGVPMVPRMLFNEDEAITLVLSRQDADMCGFAYGTSWSLMTLGVYSDLEAIGFLAAVLCALAEAGIAVNVASAFYHDHIFVPKGREGEALSVLHALSREAAKKK